MMNERVLKQIIIYLLDWLEEEHLGLYTIAHDEILKRYNVDVNNL